MLALWAGMLLTPPLAAQTELMIHDTIGRNWADEPINWDVSLEPGRFQKEQVVVKRDGRPIPAQLAIRERHPDGSVKSGVIRFLLDTLAKDATTRITAESGGDGPADTDLKVTRGPGHLILANQRTAVKLLDVRGGSVENFAPILGVRTASGKWAGGGHYETRTARPVATKAEILEAGPVRLEARVTTTFDNGRTHAVTVGLWAGSPTIELDETFDLGPDTTYQFKEYRDDRDELAWEWWSWYGDVDGTKELHPNNWVLDLNSPEYQALEVRYRGEMSTDEDKGKRNARGESGYRLAYAAPRRLEKYLTGHCQWRPDATLWYATSPGTASTDDVVAVLARSVRHWRNPNVLPLPDGITLRTGANDMRIISRAEGRSLAVECPIGLGRRTWAIRSSTVGESYAPRGTSSTALTAEIVRQNLGLDIVRRWVTDWEMTFDYPRLFIKPAEKEAYYARFKGKGVGLNGHPVDTFLRKQDQAGFDVFYKQTLDQADQMIDGYFGAGTDNTTNYPDWMLGYWHGIVVSGGLDNLAGHPLCQPAQARILKKKLAILTYCLTSRDAWADKQINYGWGTMNMPVGRWGGLAVMACSLSDHPMAGTWLKDTGRYFRMLLETEYNRHGVHISCPHYIGASATSFYAWIALANSGLAEDVSGSPALNRFARYYLQLMTPIDRRWGIRTLLTEGDTRPGSSSIPGILATLFKKSDPGLAGQLIQVWREGGEDTTSGMGIPDMLIIDPTIPSAPLSLGPQVFPGFGAVLRHRAPGTPEESYLTFLAGDFMIDHTNSDQMAFEWYEKGVPLTLYTGDLYVPGARTSLSHNTLSWDVRPEGPPTPGKGKAGDWYHDHGLPWVEHVRRPRLHLEIGQHRQKVTDTRGLLTLAADCPGAALVAGRVQVNALNEVPTRADYSTALQPQSHSPSLTLDPPFTWTRRLLDVKAAEAGGMNYLIVRDDTGEFNRFTPSFSYWSLAEDVSLDGRGARFKGQLGIDTELFVAAPAHPRLFRDAFTHDQCEPILGSKGFKRETQILARVEGQAGKGFLVVIFPYATDQPPPVIENWQGERGVKLTWRGQTHFVLLDSTDREVDADRIKAHAACLVVKALDDRNLSIILPAGGEASFSGRRMASKGPAELVVRDGEVKEVSGTDLMKE